MIFRFTKPITLLQEERTKMGKKIVVFLMVCLSMVLFCSNSFAEEKKKKILITKASFADRELPKVDWENSAIEGADKAIKAAVIAKTAQHILYIEGELIAFSPGTISNWYLMEEYLVIEYDPTETVARAKLEIPKNIFLEYLKENVFPTAIPDYMLEEYVGTFSQFPDRGFVDRSPKELDRDTGFK